MGVQTPKHSGFYSRFNEALYHCRNYAFEGKIRLSRDIGLGQATVLRLLNGKIEPKYRTVDLVTRAIGRDSGFHIDPSELLSSSPFSTPICKLFGCNCLPEFAYLPDGKEDPRFSHLRGKWIAFSDFDLNSKAQDDMLAKLQEDARGYRL